MDIIAKHILEGGDIKHALINACFSGHAPLVFYLLERYKDVYTYDDYNSALISASSHDIMSLNCCGHLDIIKHLLEVGANVHARDNASLIEASENGNDDIVRFLISKGADVHAQNNQSLVNASACGHLNIVRILIRSGADVHAQKDQSLVNALENGYLDIVEFLNRAGAGVDAHTVRLRP